MVSTRATRTRHRILDAAWRLLADRGYHQVTLDEIAGEAGISRQALHRWHFRSKGDLLLALVRRIDAVIGVPEGLARFRQAASGIEAIEAAAQMQAEVEPRLARIALVLYSAREVDPAARAAWDDRIHGRWTVARELAERLRREGLLRSDWAVKEAADLIGAVFSVHVHEYLVGNRGWSAADFSRRTADVLKAALLAPRPVRPISSRTARRRRSGP